MSIYVGFGSLGATAGKSLILELPELPKENDKISVTAGPKMIYPPRGNRFLFERIYWIGAEMVVGKLMGDFRIKLPNGEVRTITFFGMGYNWNKHKKALRDIAKTIEGNAKS